MSKEFRYDINFLRALAVMTVVLFHYNIPLFSAGFVGVDIFFVISGFLMTGIVSAGILNNKFSFVNFYLARARRIWPALIVLCLFVLLLGWFILTTADYKTLSSHVRESLLFSSNLKYLSEAGYFDIESSSKWLLHTWSLSVEWQFYLLYPFLVWILYKLAYKADNKSLYLMVGHIFFALVFFSINVFYTESNPSKSFYSLESRAWEMLLGGLAFFAGRAQIPSSLSRVLLAAGFLLLGATFVFVSEGDIGWPGYYALLPTLGAFFVIVAGHGNLFSRVSLVQWLGDRSYSIYLWHWPLMVLSYYFQFTELWMSFLFIVLSLFLGNISYIYIENPARRYLTRTPRKKAFAALALPLLACVLVAVLFRKDGVPWRLPDEVLRVEAMAKDKNSRQNECLKASARCVFGGEKLAAIVLGDSHADSTVTAVAAALPDPVEQGVLLRAASGCVYAKGAKRHGTRNKQCEEMVENITEELSAYPGVPVIFINRLPSYVFGEHEPFFRTGVAKPIVYFNKGSENFKDEFSSYYKETVCSVADKHPVYILRTVPEMPVKIPLTMAKLAMRGENYEDLKIPVSQYHERNRFTDEVLMKINRECVVTILDPEPFFCDGSFCYGQKDGTSFYLDDDHLSETGNRHLVPLFREVFN